MATHSSILAWRRECPPTPSSKINVQLFSALQAFAQVCVIFRTSQVVLVVKKPPAKAGDSGFLSVSDSDRRVPAELGQESQGLLTGAALLSIAIEECGPLWLGLLIAKQIKYSGFLMTIT